jgi:hypothetical protein
MINTFVKSACLVLATVLLTFTLLAGVASLFRRIQVVSLPILTILGVTLLMATLAIVSMAYGSFGLTDFPKTTFRADRHAVTAVSSFYFGSKTGTSAAAQAADASQLPLKPQGISPTTHPRANGTLQLITGENLNPVTSVRIVNGATPIAATQMNSNFNTVQCTLPIDGTTPLGPRDVVVADANDQSAMLRSALTIT